MKTVLREARSDASFRPVELVINIETEEEFNILRYMMSHNVSIPELLEGSHEHKDVCNVLSKIHETLYEGL